MIARIASRLLIAVLTFLIGIAAAKLGVAIELDSYPVHVKEDYFFREHRTQAQFIWGYKQGKNEAQNDRQQGYLRLKMSGWPMPPENEERLIANIRQRYGIELLQIAGCEVTPAISGYRVGYNEVMQAAIEQQYGAGFIDKLSTESN